MNNPGETAGKISRASIINRFTGKNNYPLKVHNIEISRKKSNRKF